MAKRKAEGDSPSKRNRKKSAAPKQQSIKPETPAAKAYRRKRAEKLALIPPDAPGKATDTSDVYAFPPVLPSPPPSANQTPPPVAKVDDIVPGDEKDTRDDTRSANHISTVAGKITDEDTILAILCAFRDVDLTEVALDAIMQKAAAAAKPGDAFGILFIRKFISKLAKSSIEPNWLAKVIDLLQQDLESLCDRVKCQIRSLGKLPLPKRERTEMFVDMDQLDDVVALGEEGSLEDASPKIFLLRTTDATLSAEAIKNQKSDTIPVNSKQSRRKAKNTQRQSSQPASMHATPAQTTTNPDTFVHEAKPDNGTPERPLDSVYDLFVRSAINVDCFGEGGHGENFKAYRKRIRKVWARLEPEQRAAWVKLFNARLDDVPASVKGEKLLWSQGLVAKLLPKDGKRKHKQEAASSF